MFKMYAKSFSDQINILLKRLAINENRINYKDLPYKVLFYDETGAKSHEIIFLKKYGTLYSLLGNLVTSKKLQILNMYYN